MGRTIGITCAVICGVCLLVTRHYARINDRAGHERMARIGYALGFLCWCGFMLGAGIALAAR